MKRSLLFPIFILSILLFSEIVSYIAFRGLFTSKSQLKWFSWIWWSLTIGLYLTLFLGRSIENNFTKNVLVNIFFFITISKLIVALTFTITIFIQWIRGFFQQHPTISKVEFDAGRRSFASKVALVAAAVPMTTMLWGVVKTAYNFKIHREKLKFKNLPPAFSGLKIVQISDIHTGSLQQNSQLQKAIDLVLEQQPDVIVFTGDLVNNRSDEALPYINILNQLKAPLGVFSILGNHDYGDYEAWKSTEDKEKNMELMHDIHRQAGFKLLLNEHILLEKDSEKIALIGVENWGANLNFKKYGRLQTAYSGTEDIPFKILLSHDPSHWTSEIQPNFKDINLTLSGHTHGFQFGVEIPGFKWSPSQYIYPNWAGLYRENDQFLYVNRGLGCLGYMGRVGIRPEITVIELESY
jgi:predicted MPP superfamily phosphohydrolase